MPFDVYPLPDTPCRRGIILAGGAGSRLAPMTRAINKHLLPVYDKPMIYYPLTTLMMVGIRDILIISSEDGIFNLKQLCGDGSQWGLRIEYATQDGANGIAEALLIGEQFIAGEPFALILGDNIFYGHGMLETLLRAAAHAKHGAGILTYNVATPEDYGVLSVNSEGRAVGLVEKPTNPSSNRAVTGLYFYCAEAVAMTHELQPSTRGELEITDLNRGFMEEQRLYYEEIGRGSVWFDAGTAESLFAAGAYIEIIQNRQSIGVAFPEEVALRFGYIDVDRFRSTVNILPECRYRIFLEAVLREILNEVS